MYSLTSHCPGHCGDLGSVSKVAPSQRFSQKWKVKRTSPSLIALREGKGQSSTLVSGGGGHCNHFGDTGESSRCLIHFRFLLKRGAWLPWYQSNGPLPPPIFPSLRNSGVFIRPFPQKMPRHTVHSHGEPQERCLNWTFISPSCS